MVHIAEGGDAEDRAVDEPWQQSEYQEKDGSDPAASDATEHGGQQREHARAGDRGDHKAVPDETVMLSDLAAQAEQLTDRGHKERDRTAQPGQAEQKDHHSAYGGCRFAFSVFFIAHIRSVSIAGGLRKSRNTQPYGGYYSSCRW
jgi:hypothetical protein